MHGGNPHDRDPGGTRPPSAEETPSFLQPTGLDIGLQQCELDQVVLRAAAANAFVSPRERCQRLNRDGKVSAFERREAAPQRGKV
jgi:hypothetical protein